MTPSLREVADGVFVFRQPVLDVNATLITGGGAALLVDTLSTARQAAELRAACQVVTSAELAVVNTHHHFDHCFGNATVAGPQGRVWAHEEAGRLLHRHAERMRRSYLARWRETDPQLAADLAQVRVLAPTDLVGPQLTVDVGGRPVVLRHLGHGHTAGDLVVQVPDADVLIAGDLVEHGAPPDFEDAYPLQWPETVTAMLRLATPTTVIVPGHGAVTDVAFVHGQHEQLAALSWAIREGHADGAPAEAVAARAPFPPSTALTAVHRGYAELDGRD